MAAIDPEWINAGLVMGGSVVGFIVWNVRLEGKQHGQKAISDLQYTHAMDQIVSLQNQVNTLEQKNESVFIKIHDLLNTMNIKLAHIEGSIGAKKVDED